MKYVKPIILAGGAGHRLWPSSSPVYPKQFAAQLGEKTLYQQTLLRNTGRMFRSPTVIVESRHEDIAREQAEEVGVTIDLVLEPCSKDTAICVIVAAYINQHNNDLLAIMPSDHYISSSYEYRKSILLATKTIKEDSLMTMGVMPDSPHTGYGYMRVKEDLGGNLFSIDKFIEKPSKDKAQKLIDSKLHLWNTGIYLGYSQCFLNIAQQHNPEIYHLGRNAVDGAYCENGNIALNQECYHHIEATSLEYALIENVKSLLCVQAGFKWKDLGNWNNVWENSLRDKNNNALIGHVKCKEVKNSFVSAETAKISMIGVKDLIVVEKGEHILVAHKDSSEDVKKIAKDSLEKSLMQNKSYRPWGYFQVIEDGESYRVKKLVILPGERLSLQYHNHRHENWSITQGVGKAVINGEEFIIQEGDNISVPIKSHHYLENMGSKELCVIEVQTGEILSEDDIVRVEDPYLRVG